MQKLNPNWIAHNQIQNEGGGGYNPHAKYITVAATNVTLRFDNKSYTRAQLVSLAERSESIVAAEQNTCAGKAHADRAAKIRKILAA